MSDAVAGMPYQVDILPVAMDDMVQAVRYIAVNLRSHKAAEDLMRRLADAAQGLSSFPYAHPSYRPVRPLRHDYRRVMVSNYAMFYWVDDDKRIVTVARVIYARRDISRILG